MKRILGIICTVLLTVQFSFSQVTDSVLTVRTNVIRNEKTPGANSAARIANMFQDLTNSKVSLFRTLTINGTTYDLSANRSWTITAGVWGQITGTMSNQTDLQAGFNSKQDALVSGTNIKTVGGTSVLGSGDIPVGTGTVTTVSVTTANGVSGSVATATTTPAITLTLGAITPASVNSVVISGSSTPTLAITGTTSVSGTHSGTSSGTNTGDQTTIIGNSGTATTLQTARMIGAITGDATSSGSSFDGSANNTNALTLATVNSNVGSFGSATQSLTATVNGKGLITAMSAQTVTPAVGSITGLGTGVGTFLATPTSANLASALTNETGTGNAVFSDNPTFTNLVIPSATTATTQSGSDNSAKVATDAFVKSYSPKLYGTYCSDLSTALTTGTNKGFIPVPHGFTVTAVYAYVFAAQTSGSILTIDINEGATSILSTKLTIDNNETTSTTAATPYVVSDSSIATDARLLIDFDQVGTGGGGVVVYVEGY